MEGLVVPKRFQPMYCFNFLSYKYQQTVGHGNRFASVLIYLTEQAIKGCKHRNGSLAMSLWLLESHSQLGFV